MSNNNTTPGGDATNTPPNTTNRNENARTPRNPRNLNATQHTDPNSFGGNIPEIGAVLGLKYERFKKKAASFEIFLEKVSIYVISNLKDGCDTKSMFRKTEDPSTKQTTNPRHPTKTPTP